ncbi:probably inactive leucine-rich repeat receptor-like protein kinase At5g48380 [Prosopis cineraria]|uniref:probably inactive leucine-rich repeat receptor-like protein kinase At5g48380 n=1 Tax=Prosopis cineraria TaxID=364024 RepID=UPI00240FA6EF|nr:probably inactive leucine-rich repeat receptor-like protein kinase At5g48380 [Prosopis cineraria]
MKMVLSSRTVCVLIVNFWFLLSCSVMTYGTVTDIFCLKSIKDSLEDPYGYLKSSWDFNNITEGFICRFTGVECWNSRENRVINLKLSNMGLKGQFPHGIQNYSGLSGLDLSMNKLSGKIPADIDVLLPYGVTLDISSNNFSGKIPKSVANCSYLNSLRLDRNRFSGQIPGELSKLGRLKTFTVTNNLLIGPVPKLPQVPAESYANNSGLCGSPLPPCQRN